MSAFDQAKASGRAGIPSFPARRWLPAPAAREGAIPGSRSNSGNSFMASGARKLRRPGYPWNFPSRHS